MNVIFEASLESWKYGNSFCTYFILSFQISDSIEVIKKRYQRSFMMGLISIVNIYNIYKLNAFFNTFNKSQARSDKYTAIYTELEYIFLKICCQCKIKKRV